MDDDGRRRLPSSELSAHVNKKKSLIRNSTHMSSIAFLPFKPNRYQSNAGSTEFFGYWYNAIQIRTVFNHPYSSDQSTTVLSRNNTKGGKISY